MTSFVWVALAVTAENHSNQLAIGMVGHCMV